MNVPPVGIKDTKKANNKKENNIRVWMRNKREETNFIWNKSKLQRVEEEGVDQVLFVIEDIQMNSIYTSLSSKIHLNSVESSKNPPLKVKSRW
jgi:hypothetical protein